MRGLYLILDPEQCRGRDPSWVAGQALAGGCAALQLRAKRLDDEPFVELGLALRELTRARGVPLFVNDRVWLAAPIGADGVHVGQDDEAIELVRARLGTKFLVGVSTHSLAQAEDAARRGADLIGFGPVFATSTKERADPVVGLEGLREVCGSLRVTVAAIGGITRERAGAVAAAGAKLGAVVSAVCAAPDPELAARELHLLFGGGAAR